MAINNYLKIDIDTVGHGIPVLVEGVAAYYKESCIICLDHHSYSTGVLMMVSYGIEKEVQVFWTGEATDKMRKAYRDMKRTTDNAACAFALLIMRDHGNYGIEQASADGSTIDYYLSSTNDDDTLIFNYSARLEVSGILSETEHNTTKKRIQAKKKRLKKDGNLKDIIVVVCFNPLKTEVIEV